MYNTSFSISDLGNDCHTINDAGRTVALITSQGYIDWLRKSPQEPGELITKIAKETHLCYTIGLKIMLITPTPATELEHFSYQITENGQRIILTGEGRSADGKFTSTTIAELYCDEIDGEYHWLLNTSITCQTAANLKGIEYNNIYPAHTGRCMLFTPHKKYDCILITDADGVIWRFPHQHQLHYTSKINHLHFAEGSIAGYFGEPAPAGYPVVELLKSNLPPDWGICDMYYDLHCMARIDGQANPGESWSFIYRIKYLPTIEAERMIQAARPIQITPDDWDYYQMPRFELGMNSFLQSVDIDRPDDASTFRPKPPKLVWDREVGHRSRGSLRITNTVAEETVWTATPPTQIPSETSLNITAKVKTTGVSGTGVFIRVLYHTFLWHPTPHVEWVSTLQSVPVTGENVEWLTVTVPELHVPREHFDYLVQIDIVLDGKGTAWLTDIDVDLQYDNAETPELQEGSRQTAAIRSRSRSSSGTLG